MPCEFLNLEDVLPGWVCCRCRTYNGLQRKACKRCKHEPCIALPKPSEFGMCDDCGAVMSMRHVDCRLAGQVVGGGEQTRFTLAEAREPLDDHD